MPESSLVIPRIPLHPIQSTPITSHPLPSRSTLPHPTCLSRPTRGAYRSAPVAGGATPDGGESPALTGHVDTSGGATGRSGDSRPPRLNRIKVDRCVCLYVCLSVCLSGCRLSTGCWALPMLDAGHYKLLATTAGFDRWSLVAGCWPPGMNAGRWPLGAGRWALVVGS